MVDSPITYNNNHNDNSKGNYKGNKSTQVLAGSNCRPSS